ncbi:hypothetical protein LX90_004241 [Lentzea flava]|nr:hypothetical protein [Lentzea flava]
MRLALERLDEYESPHAAVRVIGQTVDVHYETLRVWIKKALAEGCRWRSITLPCVATSIVCSAGCQTDVARYRRNHSAAARSGCPRGQPDTRLSPTPGRPNPAGRAAVRSTRPAATRLFPAPPGQIVHAGHVLDLEEAEHGASLQGLFPVPPRVQRVPQHGDQVRFAERLHQLHRLSTRRVRVVRLDQQLHATGAQVVQYGLDAREGVLFTSGEDPHRRGAEAVGKADQRAKLDDHLFVRIRTAHLHVAGQERHLEPGILNSRPCSRELPAC